MIKAGLIKRFQHLTDTSSTKVERMLGICVEWSVQTAWTPFNIFADSKVWVGH